MVCTYSYLTFSLKLGCEQLRSQESFMCAEKEYARSGMTMYHDPTNDITESIDGFVPAPIFRIVQDRDHPIRFSHSSDLPQALRQKWTMIIADEPHSYLGHRGMYYVHCYSVCLSDKPKLIYALIFRHIDSWITRIMIAMHSEFRLLLTGTPVKHHDVGMWPMLKFMGHPGLPIFRHIKSTFDKELMDDSEYGKAYTQLLNTLVHQHKNLTEEDFLPVLGKRARDDLP